jgi:pullulanase/glycogen debranching enzyme
MPEIVIKSETQKVAEAKVDGFRSDLGPFVVAAETTRMAMLFRRPERHLIVLLY